MKRFLCFLLVLLTVLLAGCRQPVQPAPAEPTTVPEKTEPLTTEPPTTEPPTTEPPTTEPPTTEPPTTEPPVTEPSHSEFYLEGVPVETVITWFNEVCLDTEYYESGDPTVIQKWEVPIACCLHGDFDEEDAAVLDGFAQWLNTLEGFPGISRVEDSSQANLQIHFTDDQGFLNIMGPDLTGLDGAVTYWYDNNAIYDGVICIRSDLYRTLRTSVILEELYNGLGPIQDTMLRPDSIAYQEFSEPQALTKEDELILKLLYHPQIQCGMDAEACERVIRELYD